MKTTILLCLFCILSYVSFGQNTGDSTQTIPKRTSIKGIVVKFCNGLSLDYGEHQGLIVIKEDRTGKTYNVLLNPYIHYEYKENDHVKIKVEPLSTVKKPTELMCGSIGNVFVGKKE